MGSAVADAVEGSASEVDNDDNDVDYLLASPVAGVVIDISLIVGGSLLIGVLTGSVLAVAVVFVGAVVFALTLHKLDLLG